MTIAEWAQRWNISQQALDELTNMYVLENIKTDASEQSIQNEIKLAAPQQKNMLWRNNSGAFTDDKNRHVRFGLGNDSAKINKFFKSSDLIGITSITVRPHHVGRTLGVFTAIEVKSGNWMFMNTEREQAQMRFLTLVSGYGGIATFAKSKEDYMRCLKEIE